MVEKRNNCGNSAVSWTRLASKLGLSPCSTLRAVVGITFLPASLGNVCGKYSSEDPRIVDPRIT